MDLDGFTTCRHELTRPLLIITGSKGSLACGYVSVATCDKLGDALAVVRGVGDFDAMCAAEVQEVSAAAADLGVQPGMTGAQALEILR